MLNKLGPFFGLVFVLAIFAALLGLKDISDAKGKQVAAKGESAQVSWWTAANGCPFDGLKAFVSVANIKTILSQTVIVAIGALGMTMIIVSGGIDLSVGSLVALTSVVGATALVKGHSPLVAACLTIAVGAGMGLVNGLVIGGLRLMAFIFTLGVV